VRVALIDNGSLEPAAHRQLRAVAGALASACGTAVAAVSWKHSDRIPAAALEGDPAWTLAAWLRRERAAGEREYLFVPFFVSPQGAVGSALRQELDGLAAALGGFSARFSPGLAESGALAPIVAARISETIRAQELRSPPVIVVDHGGPSAVSAALRDEVAAAVRTRLARSAGPLVAASMESPPGPQYAFNRPLLADRLLEPEFAQGPVVIAPLFLAPGRHAGPQGDLARIAALARGKAPAQRCHFAGLIGSHPLAIEALAGSLLASLAANAPR
jgi:hypothetical protein